MSLTTDTSPKPWNVPYLLLLVATLAEFVSLLITWPLWNVRTEQLHLPVFELLGSHQIPFGWLLILTLALIPVRPRIGIGCHFAIMLIACLFDQMRAQPQFLATSILMLSTLSQNWKNYVRWFLVSLWVWAGLHKLLSPEWHGHRAFATAQSMGLNASVWYSFVAVGVAISESSVGLLAWFKPKWGAVACVLLHLGIAVYLSPLFSNWNYSVLPWNIGSAICGAWILWTCDKPVTGRQRLSFAAFMILPIGFFFGLLDHGYAHVLYSGSIPQGLITRTDGSLERIKGWGELAIPFPNERRTLRQRFDLDSREGDRLHIRDPRWALADLHFVKRGSTTKRISRDDFFHSNGKSIVGVELDSQLHKFRLIEGGARMLKVSESAMIKAIEFNPERFNREQLVWAGSLPNLQTMNLSKTNVKDEDLELLLKLPKLWQIDLRQTPITDRGIEILSQSKTIKDLIVDGPEISIETMQRFFDSR